MNVAHLIEKKMFEKKHILQPSFMYEYILTKHN